MTTRTGWRVWGVKPDGGLTRALLHVGNEVWDAGWNEARCSRGHPTPAPSCLCGFHLMTSEADLWAFVGARYRPGKGSIRPCVAGRVEYGGRVEESLIPNDPASTLRVQLARIVFPIVLLPGAETFAPAVRERYGVPVMDRDQWELHAALFG